MKKIIVAIVLLMVIVLVAGCNVQDNKEVELKADKVYGESNVISNSGCSGCVPSEYVPPEELEQKAECGNCDEECVSSDSEKCDDCKHKDVLQD